MNIVSLLSSKSYTLGEGAVLSLVGFIIVLCVLALLVGIFYLSGMIFKSKLFNKEKKSPDRKASSQQQSDEDEEVVAAITAAIACILSSESDSEDPPEFVIKRIKRKK